MLEELKFFLNSSNGIIALSVEDIPLDILFESKKGSKIERTKSGLRYLPKAFENLDRDLFLFVRKISHQWVKACHANDLKSFETLGTEEAILEMASHLNMNDLSNEGDILEFGPCEVNWKENEETVQVTQQFYLRTKPCNLFSFSCF